MFNTSLLVATVGCALVLVHFFAHPAPASPHEKNLFVSRDTIDPDTDDPFTVVENMPQFPGKMKACFRFIEQNLQFPEAARKAGIKGSVYVQFVVSTKGKISQITVLKGLGYGCDEEAQRLISIMPDWIPGSQAGKPVPVRYTLPVQFK